MYATSDCLETWLIPSGTTRSDNSTSQPWSDETCPCNTASSTLSCLFRQKERDKAEVSTSRGGTGARCVRPCMVDSWYCLDPVVPERMSQASKRSEIVYINGAPPTLGYRNLLALLRELACNTHHCTATHCKYFSMQHNKQTLMTAGSMIDDSVCCFVLLN